MKHLLLCAGILLLGVRLLPAAPADPVFPDVRALCSTPLEAKTLKTSEKDGIVTEEVTFHVEMDGEKRVDTFAYFVYPKGAKGLPAAIWNQSGLAPADTSLAMYGVRRGYAMLCFDYPNLGDAYRSTAHYMINSTLVLTDDIQKAPIAHGAIAALKAVTFLQSRPEVDPERIGMCGNSWGGFFSTLMAGIDPRLKACAASFGTGGLQLGCAWFRGVPDAATAARWGITLDPAWRLAFAKTPMLWVSATNDNFYWMPALMRSHALAAGPKHLSIAPNWDHAAPGATGLQFDWLDVYLQGKPAFLSVSPITITRDNKGVTAEWTFDGPPARKAASAELIYSIGAAGNWRCRYWKKQSAEIRGNRCMTRLPQSALPYWIGGAVFDADGARHSTPLIPVEVQGAPLYSAKADLSFDGCSEWGSFEPNQIGFLNAQGFPAPKTSPDARDGAQAALLPAGQTTTFARPYFVAGLPHRLSCWMKAEKPVTVSVKLVGQFDNLTRTEEHAVAIGTAWTPVTMDFRTSEAMWTDLQPSVTAPAGVPVLLDSLTFTPIAPGGKP